MAAYFLCISGAFPGGISGGWYLPSFSCAFACCGVWWSGAAYALRSARYPARNVDVIGPAVLRGCSLCVQTARTTRTYSRAGNKHAARAGQLTVRRKRQHTTHTITHLSHEAARVRIMVGTRTCVAVGCSPVPACSGCPTATLVRAARTAAASSHSHLPAALLVVEAWKKTLLSVAACLCWPATTIILRALPGATTVMHATVASRSNVPAGLRDPGPASI